MTILNRPFPGAALIACAINHDERGSFTRLFDRSLFEHEGWSTALDHSAESFNPQPYTLRGLHFQSPPYEEQKLIRCVAGSIYDVAVDLRIGSPTEGRIFSITLSGTEPQMLMLPQGIAHGFLTLEPDTRVLYHLFQPYRAEHAQGIRFDDPELAIPWPEKARLIGARDLTWPSLRDLPSSLRRVYS